MRCLPFNPSVARFARAISNSTLTPRHYSANKSGAKEGGEKKIKDRCLHSSHTARTEIINYAPRARTYPPGYPRLAHTLRAISIPPLRPKRRGSTARGNYACFCFFFLFRSPLRSRPEKVSRNVAGNFLTRISVLFFFAVNFLDKVKLRRVRDFIRSQNKTMKRARGMTKNRLQ